MSDKTVPPQHSVRSREGTLFWTWHIRFHEWMADPGYRKKKAAYLDDLVVNSKRIDLSGDPSWEGKGNRAPIADRLHYGANDFGYSQSRHAGGGRGELGGRAWRVQEPKSMGYCDDDVGR